MLIKKPSDVPSSEITPKSVYMDRRKFLAGATLFGTALATGCDMVRPSSVVHANTKLTTVKSQYDTTEKQTPLKDVTNYNNFYEFSTDKYGPAELSRNFRTSPWKVKVGGEVAQKKTYDLDDLMKLATLEDRVYRMRCVEGWSMVIPWVGFSLSNLIKQVQPTSKAKYVMFTTLMDLGQFPGQRSPVLDWPYTEGLRMDEAMHPLALLTFGLYGETLPNQDGAPVRLVVPWKYGFKGIKSIVKIDFVGSEPPTAWNKAAPNEYGFYSNVNPNVDHPRWSQATERRLDGSFGLRRIPTQMFNGYADQVASLYSGMDLKKYF
ncbi:MAG TPA: protein-methionine-sulfoxide reductase catalytic subunit MsrP [Terriglobales bacterium]|jgi:sulfoxide reductase catalytic subunit YedY|nr:protein-methionine-sulfoxide reductase catalytic subunit MsrP [Terriglobales bacterium]